MALTAVLLIVQIWLLSATLESFLAGNHKSATPAAVFSGLMFLVCMGLYAFVHRVDSQTRVLAATGLITDRKRSRKLAGAGGIQDRKPGAMWVRSRGSCLTN
jgi:hypothetical protein